MKKEGYWLFSRASGLFARSCCPCRLLLFAWFVGKPTKKQAKKRREGDNAFGHGSITIILKTRSTNSNSNFNFMVVGFEVSGFATVFTIPFNLYA